MNTERIAETTWGALFPVYPELVDALAVVGTPGWGERDATVAHVLATCAGYAYADLDTVATAVSLLSFGGRRRMSRESCRAGAGNTTTPMRAPATGRRK